jgi:5-methylcytosine-specific restriction endonuclease McrA
MNKKMTVYAEYSVEEILPLLGVVNEHGIIDDKHRRTFKTPHGTFHVKVNTTRLRCFIESIACVACGIEGCLFRLERHTNDKTTPLPAPHLNMYGVRDGELILMTQDHIHPRSKGGKDYMDNLQTMCYLCNEIKQDKVA